jgi:hypothetical protein
MTPGVHRENFRTTIETGKSYELSRRWRSSRADCPSPVTVTAL